jgi:Tfp pilus assembly protein FimT
VCGYTAIQLLVTLAIAIVMFGMTVPLVRSTVASYQLRSAVNAVVGIIQTTRYQALYQGYPYKVAFSSANKNYQISSCSTCPGTQTYTNIGNAVPFTASSNFSGSSVTLGADTTLQFNPSGNIVATTGSTTLTLTGNGTTETITVSKYGYVTISP